MKLSQALRASFLVAAIIACSVPGQAAPAVDAARTGAQWGECPLGCWQLDIVFCICNSSSATLSPGAKPGSICRAGNLEGKVATLNGEQACMLKVAPHKEAGGGCDEAAAKCWR